VKRLFLANTQFCGSRASPNKNCCWAASRWSWVFQASLRTSHRCRKAAAQSYRRWRQGSIAASLAFKLLMYIAPLCLNRSGYSLHALLLQLAIRSTSITCTDFICCRCFRCGESGSHLFVVLHIALNEVRVYFTPYERPAEDSQRLCLRDIIECTRSITLTIPRRKAP
jgi:hypothetical protein